VSAYIIADVEVLEPNEYESYKRGAAASAEKFGGRYIVRGGKVALLEGDWKTNRFVIIEFPSVEKAREWFESEEYQQAAAIRHRTARSKLILVEGVKHSG
jgi:uncharacterized protein (DUF1330 family)